MAQKLITVFGGSGFLGRHLTRRLAARGHLVRVAVRDPEDALFLKLMGDVGQIVPFPADVLDDASVAAAVEGADAVVNLVGILYESGRFTFEAAHAEAPARIGAAAKAAGACAVAHVSAIGADADSPGAYGRTKAAGEEGLGKAFPDAVVLRPSVLFGPEDGFFNLFAGISRISMVLPVFGGPTIPDVKLFSDGKLLSIDLYRDGGTRFQPVYVGDVADAIVAALESPEAAGKTFELGGPTVYSSLELMRLLLKVIDRRRFLMPAPLWQLSIAGWFLEKLPKPFLTRDQVAMLSRDNVVAEGANTLADLGIAATPAEGVLPTYLARYRVARIRHADAV